ncbi:hypothetical protein NMU03_11955 [Allocoprobacillus halotolerans]|uniref:Foldase protein PrsA n=1 Tax=Allocoprobacillus halotolerans TaxID=2944914 RepID=A0ABY5HZ69_9FIRM|nr:hypothetical protein [Allocoprobacillus halotolerans]UTY38374.1 hypothetical protein NMU03_11955 [Allocoprobacillus halotolerans]
MKKIVMFLLCSSLLYGCSSTKYSVKVSDSQDALVTGSELNITKQDYFEYLLQYYGAQTIVSTLLDEIADKEITDQDKIDQLVKEREEEYAQYADGNLDQYAKNLGYESKEDYLNEALIPEVKQELLREKYIEEHLNDLIKEYHVCSFKKIVVEKESEALDIIEKATDEETFDQLMKDYGSDAEDAGVVTTNSTLDDNLKDKLSDLSQVEKDGIYDKAIKLSDDNYAVIYLYDTAHKNTDGIISSLTSDGEVQEKVEGAYLKQYHFDVYDDLLKTEIQDISDNYLE